MGNKVIPAKLNAFRGISYASDADILARAKVSGFTQPSVRRGLLYGRNVLFLEHGPETARSSIIFDREHEQPSGMLH